MDFSETIAACDLKVGRCRQLIEIMKVCEYWKSRSILFHIFSRFCLFVLNTRPRYQVSVYRTIGPLVYLKYHWGGGKAVLCFGPDRIRTLVPMATYSSNTVIMGKIL